MEKNINYLARDFESIKGELIQFSNKYYPEISSNYNDASVGSWFIDLVASVGDSLSYHIDRVYQETNVNSANMKSSVLNAARTNGVKVPGPKASLCEVKLSCVLPVDSTTISLPNWSLAPLVKRGSVVGNGNYKFEISEDVNFAEQFNNQGVSNRTFVPKRDNNGIISGYTVTKTVIAYGGESKVYKKVLTADDVQPFMEVVLPMQNIMNVESIIFKESATFSSDPSLFEYYIDEEEYMIPNQAVKTYRFFEVDSLADQYRLGDKTRFAEGGSGDTYIADEYNPTMYDDYTETIATGVCEDEKCGYKGVLNVELDDKNNPKYVCPSCGKEVKDVKVNPRTTRYYRAQWKPITQKFITEYTDNNYLKVIFGASNTIPVPPSGLNNHAQYITSKIINNDMLGVLPKVGWTMYVLYRVGGGVDTNLAQDSIKSIINANVIFLNPNITNNDKGAITRSLTVTNSSPSVAGKDAPSVEEIKYLTKYNISAQNRCVTVKDYKAKIMSIPPKYGCPYRCNVIEENNKIVVSMLGLNGDGKLDSALPQTLVENMKEYLSHYRQINDYIEMKSGKIYNLGFEIDVFVDKNYTTSDVITTLITTISDYMSVENHDMGEDIFIGDLEKEINKVDGVISLIELRCYNIYGGLYSKDKCTLPQHVQYNESCSTAIDSEFVVDNGKAYRIGLDQTDSVLYADYNSMYEILNPNSDIRIRCKLR